jgi:hypothetical protein
VFAALFRDAHFTLRHALACISRFFTYLPALRHSPTFASASLVLVCFEVVFVA